MEQPWQIYFDEFRRQAGRVPEQQFERAGAYAEAAHAAYRLTADQLTAGGWSDDRTLVLVRALNEAARVWIERETESWDELRGRLERMAAAADRPAGRENTASS